MEFASFGLSVKDLSMRNVVTMCNSLGALYTMRLPSHPAPSSPRSARSALVTQHLLGINVSATLVSMSCPNYLMILVSFSLGALMNFTMLAS
jgi:hypothetical protein